MSAFPNNRLRAIQLFNRFTIYRCKDWGWECTKYQQSSVRFFLGTFSVFVIAFMFEVCKVRYMKGGNLWWQRNDQWAVLFGMTHPLGPRGIPPDIPVAYLCYYLIIIMVSAILIWFLLCSILETDFITLNCIVIVLDWF